MPGTKALRGPKEGRIVGAGLHARPLALPACLGRNPTKAQRRRNRRGGSPCPPCWWTTHPSTSANRAGTETHGVYPFGRGPLRLIVSRSLLMVPELDTHGQVSVPSTPTIPGVVPRPATEKTGYPPGRVRLREPSNLTQPPQGGFVVVARGFSRRA